jgi:leucyl aminopeptidase
MPLAEEYEEAIKSKIADLQNVDGPYGGSITAALFLQHFVKKMKWAHIDLAGPVWNHGKVGRPVMA